MAVSFGYIPDWMTRTEAARHIGVSSRTLKNWEMFAVKPGRQSPVPQIAFVVDADGRPKYRRADLDEYLRRNPDGPWWPGKK